MNGHWTDTNRRIYSVWKVSNGLQLDLSGFKEISYEQRLRSTRLTTLEVRRQRGDLIECYKILTGKENIDSHQFFRLSDNSHGLRGHSLKLTVNISRLDLIKNFFSQRVISSWNSLP